MKDLAPKTEQPNPYLKSLWEAVCAVAAMSFLGLLYVQTAQAQTLVCDQAKRSITMPTGLYAQAKDDLRNACPHLPSRGGMQFEIGAEVVAYSRHGILGCASDAETTLSKIANKSLPLSDWFVAKGADQKCLSFLAKQFSLSEPTTQTMPLQQPSQQSQSTQQQVKEQAQQLVSQNQARADQARQGKRKTHDPAAEAHECIANDTTPGLFGGFRNQCNYKVSFYSCNYKPRSVQGGFNWSADFDCEQQKFGMYGMGPGGKTAAHTNNTETVYFFACKSPASPVDVEFVAGQGARGRCSN